MMEKRVFGFSRALHKRSSTLVHPEALSHERFPGGQNAALAARAAALEPFIGHTPLHRLVSLSQPGVAVYAKLEWCQLSGSVKARAAFAMIREAIRHNFFYVDSEAEPRRILDATSGNTGLALAAIGAQLGLPVTLCLPANASSKRKEMLRAFGAEVRLTSPLEGTDGAQQVARELARMHPDRYVYLDQYNNSANSQAHEQGTAKEILALLKPTHFIAGLGTTGTFNGTARGLLAAVPDIRLIALQPDSPMHGLEGWKHLETAVVPGIHDPSLAHEVREVGSRTALDMVRRLAREEGLLLSPSAGANAAAAAQLALELSQDGQTADIVTLFADDASKYDEMFRELWPAEQATVPAVSLVR
jgi:cysteine synthase B